MNGCVCVCMREGVYEYEGVNEREGECECLSVGG